jgi:MoaA/NifB/PqqE/SkfB family radical SAM enzyme
MKLDSLPILIVYPHSRCNCRCVMCEIWRRTETQELTVEDVERWSGDLRRLNVQEVVFSGGEPLMHSDLGALAAAFRASGASLTLLTTGLLLAERAEVVTAAFDRVIVSLDGPRTIHDRIRRAPGAFDRLASGVRAVAALPVSARCTVQKANHTALRETVAAARGIGVDSISFLAVDVDSSAFDHQPPNETQTSVGLEPAEVDALAEEVERLIVREGAQTFVRESPSKLRAIVDRFRARIGRQEPQAPPCTAPWMSAVVEADGTLRPCFFHGPVGNARGEGLSGAVNSDAAIRFRQTLDVPANPVCKNCVCSLNRPAASESAGPNSSSAGQSPASHPDAAARHSDTFL